MKSTVRTFYQLIAASDSPDGVITAICFFAEIYLEGRTAVRPYPLYSHECFYFSLSCCRYFCIL